MYSGETADRNLTRFRHLRRPLLLVDHDREFGTLMRVAFESRGERLEWTDRISDALRILACDAYDPVIIDLRLYDGSGLDLLAEAANNRLLPPECAVILASHDFTEPRESISRTTALDLYALLDRLMVLASRSRASRDTGALRIQFMLYIMGRSRGLARESDAGPLPNLRFFLRDLSDESMVA
jgi:DNA-binding response OmpR family regulator